MAKLNCYENFATRRHIFKAALFEFWCYQICDEDETLSERNNWDSMTENWKFEATFIIQNTQSKAQVKSPTSHEKN